MVGCPSFLSKKIKYSCKAVIPGSKQLVQHETASAVSTLVEQSSCSKCHVITLVHYERNIFKSINFLSGTWTWKFKYCDMIGCHLPSLQRNCLYIQFSQAVDQSVLAQNGNLIRLMLHESKIFKYFFQKEQWLTMLNIQFLLLPSFSSCLTVQVLFCSEWCAL